MGHVWDVPIFRGCSYLRPEARCSAISAPTASSTSTSTMILSWLMVLPFPCVGGNQARDCRGRHEDDPSAGGARPCAMPAREADEAPVSSQSAPARSGAGGKIGAPAPPRAKTGWGSRTQRSTPEVRPAVQYPSGALRSSASTACALDRGAGERSIVRGWIESRSASNAPATAGWMLLPVDLMAPLYPKPAPFSAAAKWVDTPEGLMIYSLPVRATAPDNEGCLAA